jgi:hypothetical protein
MAKAAFTSLYQKSGLKFNEETSEVFGAQHFRLLKFGQFGK